MFGYTEATDFKQLDVPEVTMYHGEGYNCCIKWANYLELKGFEVNDQRVDDLIEDKIEYSVHQDLS